MGKEAEVPAKKTSVFALSNYYFVVDSVDDVGVAASAYAAASDDVQLDLWVRWRKRVRVVPLVSWTVLGDY